VDFVAVVDQVIALVRQRGRVTYRTLQFQFTLDDAQLAALKEGRDPYTRTPRWSMMQGAVWSGR